MLAALRNLYALYCPLSSALLTFASHPKTRSPPSGAATPLVDSGYVSGADDDDTTSENGAEDALETLRADVFERTFATRWLTGFIARAEALPFWSSEDTCEDAINQASYVLASFSTAPEADAHEEDAGLSRDFSFAVDPAASGEPATVDVRLLDKPICTGTDHTDVGLQSWAASIVFSEAVCASPTQFGLAGLRDGPAPPSRILELGAGTGLVGLTLAKLLPHIGAPGAEIIATDYHPAVLENLRDNIRANFTSSPPPIETCLLDWSAPTFEAPLDPPMDLLVAADVIYAPEHADWLRDCAARYLAPHGVFWLMVTVRQHGKFEGIVDTVEAAFAPEKRPRDAEGRCELRITGTQGFTKRDGVGRGDEKGYQLFRIAWAEST